jgi:archaellin
MNNKAISKPIIVIIIIAVIIVAAVAAAIGSNISAPTENQLKVYIDNVEFTGNQTAINTLDWGPVQPGFTYTKNFTVVNNGNQNLTLLLLTTEPLGTTQTWPYNGSMLPPSFSAQGSLEYKLSASASSGACTWRLIASNNTAPAPTPTPTATSSVGEVCYVTIEAEQGMQQINLTINTDKITLTPSHMPKTVAYTSGSTLIFKTSAIEGYAFNYWEIHGDTVKSSNPYQVVNAQGNFTIVATYIVQVPAE